MPTIYANFISGTLSADPGLAGTTLTGTAFANLPVVSSPDVMWVVLDPEAVNGAPEVVKVTAHTTSAPTCTVVREQQSTVARTHPIDTAFIVAVTKSDLDELPFRKMTARGDMLVATATNTAGRLAVGTAGQVVTSDGTDPVWGTVGTAGLAAAAVTTAKIAAGAVTTTELADNSVTAAKIAAGAVGSDEIATDAVGADEIAAGAVGTTELADISVTAAKIATAVAGAGLAGGGGSALSVNVDASTIEINVDTLQLKDAGVTSAKLASSSVSTAKIADSAVTSAKISDGTIVNGDVATGAAISASKLAGVLVNGGGTANATVTISTSAASGTPADGDLWFQY